jgi:hypothetical protein
MVRALESRAPWVYCEWACVVNLDTEVLEISGRAEEKKPGHRFGDVRMGRYTGLQFLL